ncbi:MAG: hypothetical protein IJ568_06335 [Bacilli bacterium]|nr:hypothetical protein [Bacilli bacterium]
MEEELYKRIGEADLNPTYKDGQVYQHTDVNNMLSILKAAINENYFDIQRIQNGEKTAGNADKLDGAILSRALYETVQPDDNKIPSSQQVKEFVEEMFSRFSPPIRGIDYWTQEDKEEVVDEATDLVSEQVKIEMATFDVVDGKLIIRGTKYSEQILKDYTFRLNDNKLEVINNG